MKHVFTFTAGVALSAWLAFVFQMLWGWFVVPQFELPTLTFWGMWGLVLMLSLAKMRGPNKSDEQHPVLFTVFLFGTSLIIFALAFAVKLAGGF